MVWKMLGVIIFLAFLPAAGFSQTGVWSTLAMLKYDRNDDGTINPEGKFLPMIQRLEGKEITVRGYMIPLTGKRAQSNFMFSAYPYATCFFCGQAGPETVMEVFMEGNKALEFSETPVELKGVFRFQPSKGEIMYTLEKASLIKG
jgi:hypothetical protein